MVKEIENIQVLCADIVQKANSGHPGAPLGLSQFVHILFTEYLNLNPDNTNWIQRDIFILSNGHACTIQYLMNSLLGILPREELFKFRQIDSLTPGHPEKNQYGIEITTGPLGQGVAASVGFAISSKILQKYGMNNKIYCIFGDGCYQEGISQEAFSICSRLKLDNITFIYDFNKNTIDGSTELSMDENVVNRFKGLNFDVIEIQDDPNQIREALDRKSNQTKMIILHTAIGKNSELEGSCKSHGSPLGEENVLKLKEKLGMPKEDFYFSDELVKAYEKAADRMRKHVANTADLTRLPEKLKNIIDSIQKNKKMDYFAEYKTEYSSEDLATRKHLSNALNDIFTNAQILSGCADLTPSIGSQLKNTKDLTNTNFDENSYVRFGIREHAMCGIMNGLASHGIFTPFGGTFLNFSSYGLGSIRLACLDRLKIVYIFTHDSLGLGEDGPTHQPIESLAILRAIPNMTTYRPCDGRETRSSLALALKNNNGPSAIVLTRQKVPDLEYTKNGNIKYCEVNSNIKNCDVEKGGYYLIKEKEHDIIIIATGSEVSLALKARELLTEFKVSVVSMLSFQIFDQQSEEYKKSVLDKNAKIISIETLTTFGWSKYSDFQIGQDEFGRSGPGNKVFEYFGFYPEAISEKIRNFMNKK